MTMTTDRRATLTLPADDQIQIVREFDASPDLVFRAYTEPDLVRQWWHANRGTITECTIDARPGGAYRFAMNATEGGFEVAFHGEFTEVVPGERIVATEIYEGAPPEAQHNVNTVTFADNGAGGTTLTIVMECGTREQRDAIIASGMEDGLQDALALMEEVARAA